jgi:hypothetical protein
VAGGKSVIGQAGDEETKAVLSPEGVIDRKALEDPSGSAAAATEGIVFVKEAEGALHIRFQFQVVVL